VGSPARRDRHRKRAQQIDPSVRLSAGTWRFAAITPEDMERTLPGSWKPDVPQDHGASALVPLSVRLQLHAPSASISSTASYSSTDTAASARVMYVMEFSSRRRST
jgi:hypothetical protein